ncbi:erythroferrone [Microcaecilia unicolor]|uniref:Adipolin n=1 Tax=Microcaecilia unicolor TaxID=1415580 RepID=A0A6P7Z404_9AMPH|nr:erythroferrone [Microcaecilia unicolor]
MAPGSLPPGCWLMLLFIGCLTVVSCFSSSDSERNRSKKLKEKKSQWKEYPLGQGKKNLRLPASNDPEIVPENARYIDPHDAWMLFIKHSNKGVNSKKRSKGNSRKPKHQLHSVPGPPGPRGPQGLPGDLLTKEKMLQEFRLLLQEALQQREIMELKACEDCEKVEEGMGVKDERESAALIGGWDTKRRLSHHVEAAFHCRLRRNVSVERRSLQELQIYYSPEKEGSFHRGLGLNFTSGQYTAPISGFYTFTARLQIANGEHQKRGQQRPRDCLRVLICIQSLCQSNASLETVTGLESNSEVFTVSVSGVLYLQAGQYASVFVDNASGSSLIIRCSSDFSGILLGV